jgi:hypothetical protein
MQIDKPTPEKIETEITHLLDWIDVDAGDFRVKLLGRRLLDIL